MGQTLNLTVWVIIDITCWYEKLIPLGIIEGKQKKRKTVKDMIDKEFTVEFSLLFDLILDVS